MGFLDDLNKQAGGSCKVARWLKEIDPKYRAEIEQAMAGDFPSRIMWRVIVQRDGLVFSDSVFARHRKGECSCGLQG